MFDVYGLMIVGIVLGMAWWETRSFWSERASKKISSKRK